jgi:hypothetical protein
MKTPIKQKIINNFQSAGEEKWDAQKRGTGEQRPHNAGEIAAPMERAMLVTPEAAERSSGLTTAIV